mmetsp:Transcript_4742/g.8432  ORF Transcript_4742/g.8432 Transcript_4742/m.8432 type:complete len:87 (+) Transcript_4742:2-262(+)
MDQSQRCAGSTFTSNCEPKPILPDALHDRAAQSTNSGARAPSAIARPASSTGKSDRDGSSGGGFSFFCISPRSFLSGRKAKTQRLN